MSRRVILAAQIAATARQGIEVEPSHFLLGLLAIPESGGRFLLERGITEAAWSAHLPPVKVAPVPALPVAQPSLPPIPDPVGKTLQPAAKSPHPEAFLSAASKQILHDSATESRSLHAPSFGSHHLLLALLKMRDEPATQWLAAQNITYKVMRETIIQSGYNELRSLHAQAARSSDSLDFKLNLKCFLLTFLVWVPLPFVMVLERRVPTSRAYTWMAVLPLFALPVLGCLGVIGLLIFGRSRRLKTAGVAFVAGFVVAVIVLGFLVSLLRA